MQTVAAVVVTRNRPALLKRCLAAINSQTYPVVHLVVVDNASDQPTRDLLAAEAARRDASFQVIRMDENTGPAGGFSAGMRACLNVPCSHIWLIDDDCLPDPNAVQELIGAMAIVGENAVLGSNAFDLEGECINVQPLAVRIGANGVPQFPFHLAEGLLEVSTLTFVSFLVSSELVRKVGLPLKEFFLWHDDHEYSLRLGRLTRLYQVGKSRVTHLKSGDAGLRIAQEKERDKILRYWWRYRNKFYVVRKYYGVLSKEMAKHLYRDFRDLFACLQTRDFPLLKCKMILGGLFAGVGFSLQMARKNPADLAADE